MDLFANMLAAEKSASMGPRLENRGCVVHLRDAGRGVNRLQWAHGGSAVVTQLEVRRRLSAIPASMDPRRDHRG